MNVLVFKRGWGIETAQGANLKNWNILFSFTINKKKINAFVQSLIVNILWIKTSACYDFCRIWLSFEEFEKRWNFWNRLLVLEIFEFSIYKNALKQLVEHLPFRMFCKVGSFEISTLSRMRAAFFYNLDETDDFQQLLFLT